MASANWILDHHLLAALRADVAEVERYLLQRHLAHHLWWDLLGTLRCNLAAARSLAVEAGRVHELQPLMTLASELLDRSVRARAVNPPDQYFRFAH